MTTPQPPARPAPRMSLSQILLVVGGGLFVIAAFAAGGDTIGTIPAWSWGFAGFAAWVWSGVVP